MNQEQLLSPEERIADERRSVINGAVDRLVSYDLTLAAKAESEKQDRIFAAYAKSIEPAPEAQSPIGGMVVESEANSVAEAEQAVARALEEFGSAN